MDDNIEAKKAELRQIAKEKGKDGNATPKARAAQLELIELNGGTYIGRGHHCHSKHLSDHHYEE